MDLPPFVDNPRRGDVLLNPGGLEFVPGGDALGKLLLRSPGAVCQTGSDGPGVGLDVELVFEVLDRGEVPDLDGDGHGCSRATGWADGRGEEFEPPPGGFLLQPPGVAFEMGEILRRLTALLDEIPCGRRDSDASYGLTPKHIPLRGGRGKGSSVRDSPALEVR